MGELGFSLYLARQASNLLPYATVSAGRLLPDDDNEDRSWHPAVAAGMVFRAQQTVGLIAELKYSHSTAGDQVGSSLADRWGRLWLQGGIRIAF